MAGRKRKKFNTGKQVREIARERVGAPPPARPIEPERRRKKPKHKKPPDATEP